MAAPAKAGAGAPQAKKGLITKIYADDVLTEPSRDSNGVKMLGNYVLKAGAKMHTLYATPSTQKVTQDIIGDEDFEALEKKVEAVHPGNSLDIREMVANELGVGVILIFGENCGDASGSVLGSKCNPMKLKGNYTNDKDGVKNMLQYEAAQADRFAIGHYTGEITLASNFVAADVDLELTVANGPVQQLPSLDTTDAITATSIDLETGTMVSLIGGGGSDPATLSAGTQGAVDVVLINGTQWAALKDAVINLEVVNGGATKYLVERSRA